MLKVPAADPTSRLGSLVINPGGPGEPGTSYAALGAQAFGQPLLDHFDLVGFDPRGTGDSSPVDCLSDAALDRYLAADPEPSTPREVASLRVTQHQLATGCSRLSGALASHISTVEAAKDMDILRAALGDGCAQLPRRLLRDQARCDLRPALPPPRRPLRARRRGRRLARHPRS